MGLAPGDFGFVATGRVALGGVACSLGASPVEFGFGCHAKGRVRGSWGWCQGIKFSGINY